MSSRRVAWKVTVRGVPDGAWISAALVAYNPAPVFRRSIVFVAFAALACAAAPGAARMPAIAPGVDVLAVPVAGLDLGARARPARGSVLAVDPRRVRHAALVGLPHSARGGRAIDAGVSAALAARPATCRAARRLVEERRAARLSSGLARTFDRDAVDAALVSVSSAAAR